MITKVCRKISVYKLLIVDEEISKKIYHRCISFSQKAVKKMLQAHKKIWSNNFNITRHYATSLLVQAVDSLSDSLQLSSNEIKRITCNYKRFSYLTTQLCALLGFELVQLSLWYSACVYSRG